MDAERLQLLSASATVHGTAVQLSLREAAVSARETRMASASALVAQVMDGLNSSFAAWRESLSTGAAALVERDRFLLEAQASYRLLRVEPQESYYRDWSECCTRYLTLRDAESNVAFCQRPCDKGSHVARNGIRTLHVRHPITEG